MENNIYIQHENGKIIGVNVGNYIITSDDFVLFATGVDDDYVNVLMPKGIMTEHGGFNYAYVNGEIVERTAAEIAADEHASNPEPSTPATDDVLNTLLGVDE